MNDTISSQYDESQPMSLRERKKRLAQATIEETALRLFQQQGSASRSVSERSGDARPSFRGTLRVRARRGR